MQLPEPTWKEYAPAASVVTVRPSLPGKATGVLELVEDFDRDTYRAVYTVKFTDAIYVLHVFQKKSEKGIKTPQKDLDSL